MRYLITTKFDAPFLTKWYEYENHFNSIAEMVIYDLVTFFDDILDELRITGEWRIEKPGVDKEKGYRFNSEVWPDEYGKYVSGKNRSLKVQARKHLEYLNAAANSRSHNRDVNQKTLR